MTHIYHGTRARAIRYVGGHTRAPERRPSIMAKLKEAWEGLTSGFSGTFIMPHEAGGYTFGRWSKCRVTGGYRFTRLGDRSTREACREGLRAADLAADARARALNKRGKRRD